MKLKYIEGCTSRWIEVNGEDFADLPHVEKKAIFDKIAEKFTDDDFATIISDYIEAKGEMTECYNCEQCGDSNFTFELEI